MKNSIVFYSLMMLAISIQTLNAQKVNNLNEIDKDFLKKNNNTQQVENKGASYKMNAQDNSLTSLCEDAGFENSASLDWANWHGYYGKLTAAAFLKYKDAKMMMKDTMHATGTMMH